MIGWHICVTVVCIGGEQWRKRMNEKTKKRKKKELVDFGIYFFRRTPGWVYLYCMINWIILKKKTQRRN